MILLNPYMDVHGGLDIMEKSFLFAALGLKLWILWAQRPNPITYYLAHFRQVISLLYLSIFIWKYCINTVSLHREILMQYIYYK